MHCATSAVFGSLGLQKTKTYPAMVISSHGQHFISSIDRSHPSLPPPSCNPSITETNPSSQILKPCHPASSTSSSMLSNPPQTCIAGSGELDPRLWHACAGSVIDLPAVNSQVVYFPNGHAQACYGGPLIIPNDRQTAFACTVTRVEHLADELTDEVYARVVLIPEPNQAASLNPNLDTRFGDRTKSKKEYALDRLLCFAKTLTQSDANNGGGFSVPRYCAETIFPSLDYSLDPPLQTLVARDVHGKLWKFRHIYRGTPRRHLLTTGWSTFVNAKKLTAGDTVVFLRSANNELCVGIRRSQTEFNKRTNQLHASDSNPRNLASMKTELRNSSRKSMAALLKRKTVITSDDVSLSFELARQGKEFEIVLFPRGCSSDYCMDASSVMKSLSCNWKAGTRCRLAYETDDVSHPGWLYGTVQSANPISIPDWPQSAWRSLTVIWDDAEQNTPERLSPWQIEMIPSGDNATETVLPLVIETSKRQRTVNSCGQESTSINKKSTSIPCTLPPLQSNHSVSPSPSSLSPSHSTSLPYHDLSSPNSPSLYHRHLMPSAAGRSGGAGGGGSPSDRKRSSPSSSLASIVESSITNLRTEGCVRHPVSSVQLSSSSDAIADSLSPLPLPPHAGASFPKYAWPIPLSSACQTVTASFSPGGTRSMSPTNTRSEESLMLALSCQSEERTDGSGQSRRDATSDRVSEKVNGSSQSMMLFGRVIESNPNTGVFKRLHVAVPRTDSWQDTAMSPASLVSPFSPSFPFQNCYTPSNSYELNGLMEKNLILDWNALKKGEGNHNWEEKERERKEKERLLVEKDKDIANLEGEINGGLNFSSAYVCKVFVENESVGRSVDLARCHSHDELACHLASFFRMNPRDVIDRLVFHDANSEWLLASSIPYEKLMLTAKRAMILSSPLSHK